MLRKLCLCLFYALCAFALSFSLLWIALPALPAAPAASEAPAGSSAENAALPDLPSLLAQAAPQAATPAYYLCDLGGRVAVYACDAGGAPGELVELTDIYVNLLPERDAVRLKDGLTVPDDQALAALLEDLGA